MNHECICKSFAARYRCRHAVHGTVDGCDLSTGKATEATPHQRHAGVQHCTTSNCPAAATAGIEAEPRKGSTQWYIHKAAIALVVISCIPWLVWQFVTEPRQAHKLPFQ